jgi:hypothetical protein
MPNRAGFATVRGSWGNQNLEPFSAATNAGYNNSLLLLIK